MATVLALLTYDMEMAPICMCVRQASWGRESRGAVVVTLDSTSIGACSSGALVSKGRFVGLCLRFADDFEASLDDWKPAPGEPSLNVCCVSEGTYEVCSRTATAAAAHNGDHTTLHATFCLMFERIQ